MTLSTDTDAVSPVIGVVLMLSITVILATVIGTVVLGTTEGLSSGEPLAEFEFEYNRTDGYSCSFRQDSFGEDALSNNCYGGGEFSMLPGEGGILVITHTGGDTIPADQLYVVGTSTYDDPAWSDSECLPPGIPNGENCNLDRALNYNETDEIVAGDQFEIWIRDTDDILLVWSSGGDSAVLARYDYE